MHHIVSATDLATDDVRRVFARANRYSEASRQSYDTLRGKIVAHAFEEPSTRTWTSFIAATLRLGGDVLPIPDAGVFSSFAKGESHEDTARILSANCDLIVMRLKESGGAARFAKASLVPFINAGDGENEHPTQALLDLFTIWEAKKARQMPETPLNILFFGDNAKSRTVRSLALLLARDAERVGIELGDIEFGGINSHGEPPKDVIEALSKHLRRGRVYGPELPVSTLFGQADVVYLTRTQKERYRDGELDGDKPFVFTLIHAAMMPRHGIIMHPLPRAGELSPEVDTDPRAWYFRQASNGLYIRMALLELLLGVF